MERGEGRIASQCRGCIAGGTERERAVALLYAVRDGFRYDPYRLDLSPAGMKASAVLAAGYGWCVTKATLLAALCRAAGIAARAALLYLVFSSQASKASSRSDDSGFSASIPIDLRTFFPSSVLPRSPSAACSATTLFAGMFWCAMSGE